MVIKEFFSNAITYAQGIEKWVRDYFDSVGYECEYTFVSDLAMAEWVGGVEGVNKTYNKLKNEWGGYYKAFTELVMSINLLSWANEQLERQGFTDRGEWIEFYSKLYYKSRNEFYEKYEGNEEATDYFFNTTD